jgi:death on curing protein
MAELIYLTIAEAKAAHKQLIEEFGGSHGLRDEGRLEAATLRPQTGYYDTLADNATALMESLGNNHPFIDGNKRVGFVVTDAFLRANRFYLQVDALKAHKFITESMSRGKFRFEAIREWISTHLAELEET